MIVTTTPALRGPATDQLDHRALAYNAAMNLAELSHAFDPQLRVKLEISATGAIDLQLVDPSATLRDAAGLADRLGLAEHTWKPSATIGWRYHFWNGARGGFTIQVAWIDPDGAS